MDSEGVAMLFAFIALTAIAAFVANDARKRGESPALWFIFVVGLAIVAVPVYFITRKPLLPQYRRDLPGTQPSQMVNPTPSLCPECGKYYAGKSAFCPHCGKSQKLEAPPVIGS